ncbi:MAG: TIGR03435 family protein [Candidatus Solibacter sp.]
MQQSAHPLAIAVFAAASVFAQAPDTRPSFVVASIKPNTSGSGSSSSHGSKGQIVMDNQSLHRLVERAYNVKAFQVSGPDWMESAHFDIAAKYPPDTTDDEKTAMLRTLLEDRFKLVAHRESKEKQGYALVVAKSGFKLKPVEAGSAGTDTNTNGRVATVTATRHSMSQVADFVARRMSETVVDRTELTGVYDYKFRFTIDDQSVDGVEATGVEATGVPTLPAALLDNLGLRLQAQKIPVEFIVVDRVERVPVEN